MAQICHCGSTDIGPSASSHDGQQSECRSCKKDRDARYYLENKEKFTMREELRRSQGYSSTQKVQDWRAANPEAYKAQGRESARRRRARINGSMIDPSLTLEYAAIVENDPCSYCGLPSGVVDHIVPLSRGGTHEWMNFTGACDTCNRSKFVTPAMQFLLGRVVGT
jgi:5-methylcytosine-specific restriction endonuclease McrA